MKSLRQRLDEFSLAFERDQGYGRTARHHKITLAILNRLNLRSWHKVLDIGCGRGIVIKELDRLGVDVTGVEPCPFLYQNDLRHLHIYPNFAGELPEIFEDQTFDFVICLNVADHLRTEEEARKCLAECYRITRQHCIVSFNSDLRLQTITMSGLLWLDILKDECPGRIVQYDDPFYLGDIFHIDKNADPSCSKEKPG